MGVFRVCAGTARVVDESTLETRIGSKDLSHQAQDLSLEHQQQTAS